MISELRIKNIALIREITIELDQGFTVFTGETGAGKSILVGSLGLLLGDRASKDLIRNEEDDAEVTAVFDTTDYAASVHGLLDDMGIEPEHDETVIIRRVVSRKGKSKTYINQVPVPLSSLKRIGEALIDFHGQHDHQSLLHAHTAYDIVDSLPGVMEYRTEYDKAYRAYTEAKETLASFSARAQELRERRDMIEYQYNEIHGLELTEREESRLEEELNKISSVTQRVECAAGIHEVLSGEEHSLLSRIDDVSRQLRILAGYDPSFSEWSDEVDNMSALLSELTSRVSAYAEDAQEENDPSRIDHINERLAGIQRLKRKYGCDLQGLIDKEAHLRSELDTLENVSFDKPQLEKRCQQAYERCMEAGTHLRNARCEAAHRFDSSITGAMQLLGFSHGRFSTRIAEHESPGPHGLESIEFTVQTNKGEPFTPLRKTASGGEISRLMLAIKSVLADKDNVPVLIFDEIDTGIGGVTANAIGAALRRLGAHHQVICISHLHQIASQAQQHFKVYKTVADDRTVTYTDKLDTSQKIDELSRMMGGSSKVSKQHAEEILNKSPAR
jgi:DNA repair protein RecN (Recombination protein N)